MNKHKELVEEINVIAKENLKKDGKLAPIAFVIKNTQMIAPILLDFRASQEKYKSCKYAGAIAKYLNADAVILVSDVAMKEYKSKEEADFAVRNYSTESPLSYPESMRVDGIFLLVIDLETKKIEGYMQLYEKKGDNYTFKNLEDFSGVTGIGGMIQESVIEGYDLLVSKEDFDKYLKEKNFMGGMF